MKIRGVVIAVAMVVVNMNITAAQAETTACTAITALPYTITTQGAYCLTSKLATSQTTGAAITVSTNNVVIDLNGFALGGLGAGTLTQAIGILANNMQNITVRNGVIRGFYAGITLYSSTNDYTASSGHLVEDVLSDQNRAAGIVVHGSGSTVRNNKVYSTQGSLATNPLDSTTNNYADGISIGGAGSAVLNNDIINTDCVGCATGSKAEAINLKTANGAIVQGNRVTNATMPTATKARAMNLSTTHPSANVLASQNLMSVWPLGVDMGTGGSSAKCTMNFTTNVTTFSNGCTLTTSTYPND